MPFSLRLTRPMDNATLAALYTEPGNTCSPADMSTRPGRVVTDPAHAAIVAESHQRRGLVRALTEHAEK